MEKIYKISIVLGDTGFKYSINAYMAEEKPSTYIWPGNRISKDKFNAIDSIWRNEGNTIVYHTWSLGPDVELNKSMLLEAVQKKVEDRLSVINGLQNGLNIALGQKIIEAF